MNRLLLLLLTVVVSYVGGGIWGMHTMEDATLAVTDIKVIKNHEALDEHLEKYKEIIGEDYVRYRNHCLRAFSYAMHFLKGKSKFLKV